MDFMIRGTSMLIPEGYIRFLHGGDKGISAGTISGIAILFR